METGKYYRIIDNNNRRFGYCYVEKKEGTSVQIFTGLRIIHNDILELGMFCLPENWEVAEIEKSEFLKKLKEFQLRVMNYELGAMS